MRIHQCPRCELRFRDENEVRAHLTDDHGLEPQAFEPHFTGKPQGVHSRRHTPDVGADQARDREQR